MKIGSVILKNPVVLAPMAGVTDLPFRVLVKEMGCALVYSEMVSDKGLIYDNCHTVELMKIDKRERPVAVQIFGSEPESMARAAELVEKAGADIIDINMGCPTPKIVKNGEGSALMRKPELAFEIIAEVVKHVQIPVTIKIRKGWDDSSVNAVEMALLAEKAGAQAIAVHGRTREQFYAGNADWDIIKQVKRNVRIPVIGNGDIKSPEDAKQMMEYTNCDAIMVGRAAQGNPWLIQRIVTYLTEGIILKQPDFGERRAMLLRHLDMLLELKGEYIGIREMRRHAVWYIKGLPFAAEIRAAFHQAKSKQDFIDVLDNINNQMG